MRVVARIRPLAEYELNNGSKESVLSLNDPFDPVDTIITTTTGPELVQVVLPLHDEKRWFELDAVFDKNSSQKEVYIRSGAKEAVCESIFGGFNCTILAYGQTGAGKTYSMGSASIPANGTPIETLDEHAGMIPRACHDLFEQIQEKCDGNAQVELSYLEIYNEALRDLLSGDNHKEELRIRENMNGEIYVSGLISRTVASPQDIGVLMEEASSRRIVASTAMNAVSSRSHAMCVLRVKGLIEVENGSVEKFESKLTLVDLAGSERMKKTGAQGDRQKEGININKSLLVLGQVVAALSDQSKKNSRKPPYRDSKLTRLLQDSLGGNSRTIMLACVSPAECNIEESINTLRYATSARNIKNTATRNIVQNISAEEAAKLQRENQLLKKQVEELQRSLQLLSGGVSQQPHTNTQYLDSNYNCEEKKGEDFSCLDTTPDDCIKALQSKVKILTQELHDVRQSAGFTAVELPSLKMETEVLREQIKEMVQLKVDNCELQQELMEVKADAAASRKAAAKLSVIMDKLRELKSDEIDKKRVEYNHIKVEEMWVKFLADMLQTRKDEMGKLEDDFDLVVRVVESRDLPQTLVRSKSVDEQPQEKSRWRKFDTSRRSASQSPRAEETDEEELRQQLLTQHLNFFNSQMAEITQCINVEITSLAKIQKSLHQDREKLENDIDINEFVKDSLNSGDAQLLEQLTSILVGPVHQI